MELKNTQSKRRQDKSKGKTKARWSKQKTNKMTDLRLTISVITLYVNG